MVKSSAEVRFFSNSRGLAFFSSPLYNETAVNTGNRRMIEMTYQEALEQARTCIGKCRACPVCNGLACKNTIPGPGAKGLGTGAIRSYQKW